MHAYCYFCSIIQPRNPGKLNWRVLLISCVCLHRHLYKCWTTRAWDIMCCGQRRQVALWRGIVAQRILSLTVLFRSALMGHRTWFQASAATFIFLGVEFLILWRNALQLNWRFPQFVWLILVSHVQLGVAKFLESCSYVAVSISLVLYLPLELWIITMAWVWMRGGGLWRMTVSSWLEGVQGDRGINLLVLDLGPRCRSLVSPITWVE